VAAVQEGEEKEAKMIDIRIGIVLGVVTTSLSQSFAGGPRLSCDDVLARDVFAGYSKTFPIAITNKGDEPLLIKRIQTSCGCTVVGRYMNRIAPGKTEVLPVRYVPNKSHGTFEQKVVIQSNDRDSPYRAVRLCGNIVQPTDFLCSKTRINLVAIVGTPVQQPEEITLSSKKPLTVTKIINDSETFLVRIRARDRHRTVMLVQGTEPVKRKISEGVVHIFFTAGSSDRDIEIPVRYEIKDKISAYPNRIRIPKDADAFYSRIMVRSEGGPIGIEEVKVKGIKNLLVTYRKYDNRTWFIYLSGGVSQDHDFGKHGELIILVANGVGSVRVPISFDD